MANLNIICKSDKCEFVNYFSEPLVFPKNAEISLVKANLTVPVIAQQVLVVPAIEAADRTKVWLDVILDGIEETFTWRNLYDTWNSLAGADQTLGTVTEDIFFSGFYEFFLNNPIKIYTAAQLLYKTSFQETFARMLTERYAFYKVTPVTTWKRTETEIQVAQSPANWWTGIGGLAGAVSHGTPVRAVNWGVNSVYNPRGMSGRNAANMNLIAGNNVNWTIATNNLTSITGGGAGVYHNLHYDVANSCDPNGGYYHFNKNAGGTGLCAIGVKVKSATVLGTRVPATLIDTTIIDVGLEFGRDAANTVRVMDGYQELTPGVYSQSFAPTHPIDEFTATDEFFILVQRGSIIGPNTNKMRVMILHGIGGSDIDDCTIIYESSVIGPASGGIEISLIAMAQDVGHEITNLTFIPVHQQSIAQAQVSQDTAEEGVQYQGNLFIRAGNDYDDTFFDNPQDEKFFNILGLNKFQQDSDNFELRAGESNNPLQLKWSRPLQVLAKDCSYSIAPT